MTNLESVKELYLALGGSEDDFDAQTTADGIALCSEVAESAGPLVVDMGRWTNDGAYTDGDWSDDGRAEKVLEALLAGRPVLALVKGASDTITTQQYARCTAWMRLTSVQTGPNVTTDIHNVVYFEIKMGNSVKNALNFTWYVDEGTIPVVTAVKYTTT